eukprot:CAMPEP_0168336500 /NCGR_PEP_ID=MMETSP0213-20121227/11580_1 /TAXON_ID=151035 /ORGANISM="Euplotes harpa, Strain FSP1.4" /LENGTH=182 /DNA_ID=CAMNT_0008341707 /DNA_START=196 /DNA_END=744 /DNA_ORIENTATION=+
MQVINAQVAHEHIDDDFRIVHKLLDDWNENSSLLTVVKKIHEEFEKDPPKLKKGTTPQSSSKKQQKPLLNIKKPELKDLDEKLKNMSGEEINSILDDDVFFQDFFMNLEGVKEYWASLASLIYNMKKANENLKAKAELDKLIENEIEEEYNNHKEMYEFLKIKEKEILEKFSPENIIEALDK